MLCSTFSGAMRIGMVTTVQNLSVIILTNILVKIMELVIKKTTTIPVPVMSNTAVTVVKLAISIVPMVRVMDLVTVQMMPFYHLVTSVIVRQDLMAMTVK